MTDPNAIPLAGIENSHWRPSPLGTRGDRSAIGAMLSGGQDRVPTPPLAREAMDMLTEALQGHEKYRDRWGYAVEVVARGSAVRKTIDNTVDALQTVANIRGVSLADVLPEFERRLQEA